jgi:transcriptional regulator with XRE-family HTH domain
MYGMIEKRWKPKFARFIKSYSVESLATQLDVRPSAIYHWISGRTAPRRTHAEIIQRLARERGTTLTMDAIYAHARELRDDEVKPVTEIIPARAA